MRNIGSLYGEERSYGWEQAQSDQYKNL